MRNLLNAALDDVRAAAQPDEAVLVAPTHVLAAQGAAHVVTVAGYPTGRHHTLIKASEARLAIQSGASEVWVSLDATVTDANAVLSELIAIREACPDPARLGLIVPDAPLADATLKAAHQAGYQRLIVRSRKTADCAESAAGGKGKEKGPELAAATLPVLEFPAPAV